MKVVEKPALNQVTGTPIHNFFSYLKSRQTFLATFITCLVIIFIYAWYCSYAFWTSWPTHTVFYDSLATAFAHGNIALEEKVNPALLALDNPYDPKERAGLDFPMDYSLYQGKYYLYFGPVPALPLVVLKLLGVGTIGDQYLVFAAVCGLFIFQLLLILYIRKRFFPSISAWMLPACIFFAGLILPLPRLLTDGRVYEAAIAAGQCFFLAGLYFIVTAIGDKDGPAWRFVLAGIFWALAAGSRITQSLPIGFVGIMLTILAVRTYIRTRSFSKAISPLVMVGSPLALGMIALGWYNWARFGSVSQTGFLYALSAENLQAYQDVLFSPRYILPNLYNYLAAPPKVSSVFPFLQSMRGRGELLFPFIDLPKVYYTRAMTGLLYSAPFVVFAVASSVAIPFSKRGEGSDAEPEDSFLLKWMLLTLFGSFLLAFFLDMSFFWVVLRYTADFTPALVLLSIVGFWLGCRSLVRWPVAYKIFVVAGIGLMLISVISSNLLLFSNQASVYQQLFPRLWNLLSELSSKIIALIP